MSGYKKLKLEANAEFCRKKTTKTQKGCWTGHICMKSTFLLIKIAFHMLKGFDNISLKGN